MTTTASSRAKDSAKPRPMPVLPRLGVGMAWLARGEGDQAEGEALLALEKAYQAGVRMFDTAVLYGAGRGEERLGIALSSWDRNSVVISTKAGRTAGPEGATGRSNSVFDFSADGVVRSVHRSLERLRTDYLDIVHVHDPDEHFELALRETLPSLHKLKDEGLVRAVGAGMNQAEMLARLVEERAVDCCLVAGRYTLLEQGAAEVLFPLALERGIPVLVGGVFNSGLLADPGPAATYNYRPAPEALLTRARAIQALCEKHEVPLKGAALQFPLMHPAVAGIVLGPGSGEELVESLELLKLPIPVRLWIELTERGYIAASAAIGEVRS